LEVCNANLVALAASFEERAVQVAPVDHV